MHVSNAAYCYSVTSSHLFSRRISSWLSAFIGEIWYFAFVTVFVVAITVFVLTIATWAIVTARSLFSREQLVEVRKTAWIGLFYLKDQCRFELSKEINQTNFLHLFRDTLSQRDGARLESLKLQRSTKNCRANIVIAQPSMQNQDMPGLPLDLRLIKKCLGKVHVF